MQRRVLIYSRMFTCNRLDNDLMKKPEAWTAGNRVTFSAVTDCEIVEYNATTYSIKYVVQGTEHYFIQGRKFSVGAGNYLLVNRQQPIDVFVRSRKEVLGFCIHLQEDLLQEMYAQLQFGTDRLLDQPFEKPAIPCFEEILYSDKENNLGAYLQQLAAGFDSHTGTIPVEPAGLYDHLSQHLLQVQNTFSTHGQLGVLRNTTKQELLRRLELAKEVLEAQDVDTLNIDAVAQACALSGSHFFRSFKKAYGVSPYQYLLQRRIEKAAALLKTGKVSGTEAALLCGFADGASFGKAFKKAKGVSPGTFLMRS
jgi:AraC-like DNA-binding protein